MNTFLPDADYFSQAAIDFLLGNVTAQVFDEFEATLGNRDPAMSMDTLRASAIETSSKIVIADQKEDFVDGWILVRKFPFLFDAKVGVVIHVANTILIALYRHIHIMRRAILTRGSV